MNMKQVLGTALVAVTMMASASAMARGSVPTRAPLTSPALAMIEKALTPPGSPTITIGARDRVIAVTAAIIANPTAGISLR